MTPQHSFRRKWNQRMLQVWSANILLMCVFQASAFLQRQFYDQRPPTAGRRDFRCRIRATAVAADELEMKLEALTVKELRDLLKNSTLNQRGVLSRFKLKKKLVTFLKDNLDPSSIDDSLIHVARVGAPGGESETMGPRCQRSVDFPMSMPKGDGRVHEASAAATGKGGLFERLYLQYPPLRDRNCSEVGEKDIRQTYHPIFGGESVRLTGDMDVVFVGTASCTPGITRGVSCTALRLNWNRQAIHGVPGAVGDASTNLSFNGGTWLFDCGECTQVR